MTPAFLNLGRELGPRTSLLQQVEEGTEVVTFSPQDWIERLERVKNIRNWVIRNLQSSHDRQAIHYNRKRRQLIYKLRDRVWLRNRVLSNKAKGFAPKLAPRYVGPYSVSKVASPLVYEVTDDNGRTKVAYTNDLKPYQGRTDPALD